MASAAPTADVGYSFSEPPGVSRAAHALPPTVPASENPPVPGNGNTAAPAFIEVEDEALFTTDESHHLNSAASMATEILAVAPDAPIVDASEEPESEIITKDLTLIARGRRKRFRLR